MDVYKILVRALTAIFFGKGQPLRVLEIQLYGTNSYTYLDLEEFIRTLEGVMHVGYDDATRIARFVYSPQTISAEKILRSLDKLKYNFEFLYDEDEEID